MVVRSGEWVRGLYDYHRQDLHLFFPYALVIDSYCVELLIVSGPRQHLEARCRQCGLQQQEADDRHSLRGWKECEGG